jgi:diaminopimelate dehydrogenase
VAIVGFGRLGSACARAAAASDIARIVGVVRRSDSPARLEPPFTHLPVASHLRDLERADVVLACVPPPVATGIGREVLQLAMPLVECARLEGPARDAHHAALEAVARHHRVACIMGAGWDPGMLPVLRRAFEILIPEGRTIVTAHPATGLHHTEAVARMYEVVGALATESRDAEGHMRRYVYAQLAKGTDPQTVRRSREADPLFAGEETLLFPVADIAALEEEEGHGLVLERRGTARSGALAPLGLATDFAVLAAALAFMVAIAARIYPNIAT